MIINPNLPQLDEDNDFTADEKTQMEENIWVLAKTPKTTFNSFQTSSKKPLSETMH